MYRRKIISEATSSTTLSAILHYVYRKDDYIVGRYGDSVIEGLIKLELIEKVTTNKDTFYFLKDKSMKAIDLAMNFLWNFHNVEERQEINNQLFIYCFDKSLPNGRGLVEIKKAIRQKIV